MAHPSRLNCDIEDFLTDRLEQVDLKSQIDGRQQSLAYARLVANANWKSLSAGGGHLQANVGYSTLPILF